MTARSHFHCFTEKAFCVFGLARQKTVSPRDHPIIETVPLANAAEAYERMMRNEARFRIVLVTGQ